MPTISGGTSVADKPTILRRFGRFCPLTRSSKVTVLEAEAGHRNYDKGELSVTKIVKVWWIHHFG